MPGRETREFTVGATHSGRELIATFGDRGTGRDLVAELARHPADLVLVDALTFGALEAVRAGGVRYAVLEHFFDGYYQSLLGGPLGLALRARGLRPGRPSATQRFAWSRRCPSSTGCAPGGTVRQVGPVVAWNSRVEGDPTVLVGLSTFGYAGMADGSSGARRVRRLARAGRRDHRAAHRPRELRAPAGVEVHRYVPHDELMPGVSVVRRPRWPRLGDAALAHDVPVVVLPMDPRSDHRMVGSSIERAGAGRVVPRTGPDAVAEAVGALLADGPHRGHAAGLGARVRASARGRRRGRGPRGRAPGAVCGPRDR